MEQGCTTDTKIDPNSKTNFYHTATPTVLNSSHLPKGVDDDCHLQLIMGAGLERETE